jgi:hypothetical protein
MGSSVPTANLCAIRSIRIKYYNKARTHLSLHKDAPIPRAVQTSGRTLAVPVLADCTTNISERRFPTGTAVLAESPHMVSNCRSAFPRKSGDRDLVASGPAVSAAAVA